MSGCINYYNEDVPSLERESEAMHTWQDFAGWKLALPSSLT